MKIEVVRVSRCPKWPLWAVLVVALWLTLGAAAIWLGHHLGQIPRLCLFKNVTGFDCPTCGFTRGTLSLLHGHFVQAWLFNPLLFSILAIFFSSALVRVFFARSLRITLTDRERTTAWILGVMIFLVNWAYVIFYVK